MLYNCSTIASRVSPQALGYTAICRSSAALTVIKRTGKRPTQMAVGGQENFGIYSGTIFSMIEEYDFEENDW